MEEGDRVSGHYVHVYYAERVLSMPDGLPKFKDFPVEYGGSGDTLSE